MAGSSYQRPSPLPVHVDVDGLSIDSKLWEEKTERNEVKRVKSDREIQNKGLVENPVEEPVQPAQGALCL